MNKPIRVVFTINDEPWVLNGKVQDKLWTANGDHWLKSDGPFPYDDCEERHVEYRGGGSILDATPN